MTRLFGLQYAEAPMHGRPLMVSHMINLAPVYNQEPNGTELLDFAKRQVQRMEEFQNRPDSHMLYFAADTLYRDYWMGGKPDDALNLVRSAVEEHGAWGVKVYPPSGYRAGGNKIKPRPTGIRARISKKLIYGTDWYPPDAAERHQVLLATRRAFLHGRLRGHYKNYFFGNALRYLNAKTRLDDTRRPVPAAVQNRFEQALGLSSE